MLGKPDGVVALAIHDLEALDGAGIDGIEIDLPVRPPEKLENPDFHLRLPPDSQSCRAEAEKRCTDADQPRHTTL